MSEKKILLLGAGLVTEPLVKYLLNIPGFQLTVASRTVSKAEALINGHPQGTAKALNVKDENALEAAVRSHDLSISLLPAPMHPVVAKFCLKHGKHLVTTSYVSPAMQAFDAPARDAGLLFLNEIGLDPGIDHMSAMRIIHEVEARGGSVTGFRSYCGGLPAPEANDNPFGYKFSWAPRGVLTAGTNSAKFLWNGALKDIPGRDLFLQEHPLTVNDMEFEAYPNRDSMPYQGLYGLENVTTMFRGTLRNKGWCKTLKGIVDLGYLDTEERAFAADTYSDLLRELIQVPEGNVRHAAARILHLDSSDKIFDRMEWLGLFSEEQLDPETSTALDHLCNITLKKLKFKPGERDMIVLHHIFDVVMDGEYREITSTLVDYGIPHGQSAMARTVSLPAAIATRMILQGEIDLTGVVIPVMPEVYNPVLDELARMNIVCEEKGL